MSFLQPLTVEDPSILSTCTTRAKRIGNVGDIDPDCHFLGTTESPVDVNYVESLIPKEFGSEAVEVPGARAMLASLDEAGVPWAIVTSGSRPLMTGWLDVMQLAHPKVNVVAEDVAIGKPDPACYVLGRERLGLRVEDSILVIEDAPAGVRAGKAAGFQVIGLITTHTIQQIKEAGADWLVKDLRSIRYAGRDGQRIKMEISNAFVI